MSDLLETLLSDAISSAGVVPLLTVIILVLAVYALSRGKFEAGGLLGKVFGSSSDDDEPLEFDVEIDHTVESVEVKNRPEHRVSDSDLEILK